jgi:hypothetical protein
VVHKYEPGPKCPNSLKKLFHFIAASQSENRVILSSENKTADIEVVHIIVHKENVFEGT